MGGGGARLIQCQETARIDRHAISVNFQMQVRAGRAPCITDRGNLLPLLDQVTLAHLQLIGVGITGFQAIAVIDFYHIAVGAVAGGKGNHASPNRINGGTAGGGKIQTVMHREATGDRIGTTTKTGRQAPVRHRDEIENGVDIGLPADHQILQQLQLAGAVINSRRQLLDQALQVWRVVAQVIIAQLGPTHAGLHLGAQTKIGLDTKIKLAITELAQLGQPHTERIQTGQAHLQARQLLGGADAEAPTPSTVRQATGYERLPDDNASDVVPTFPPCVDARGARLLPGLYLLGLEIEGEAAALTRLLPVGVAY